MRLVHLTDPHLTSLSGQSFIGLAGKRWTGYLSWRRKRRFVHRPEVLEQLTRAVRDEAAQQIVLTGDLAHIGLPQEIAQAVGWLESLGSPAQVRLVPGNHDVYARDSWPAVAQLWADYIGLTGAAADAAAGDPAAPYPVLREIECDGGRVRIVGLSSACRTPLFMASGRLGAGQLARFEAMLDAANAFTCVLIHHPPLPGMESWRKGLHDAAALARLLDRHPPMLVLHGHGHHNVTATTPGGSVVLGTASASSASAAAPACYRVLDVTRNGDGWHIDMCLKQVGGEGPPQVIDQRSWRLPAA
ncbi:MAG: metallophosphoesterase [Pseudomonadales bacterium]